MCKGEALPPEPLNQLFLPFLRGNGDTEWLGKLPDVT
jgi:hypothetical protein